MPKASSLSAIFQWNLRLGRGVQRTKKNQQTEMNRAELDPKGLFLRFTVRFGLGNMENTNISLIFIFRCQKPNEPTREYMSHFYRLGSKFFWSYDIDNLVDLSED